MIVATTAAAAALATAVNATTLAIVVQDQTALRAAPSATAATHAQLWQGELVEVRGHKLDHAQVYEHRRERAGYVRISQLRALPTSEADAPQLLAVLRFLRDAPGSEALGIAYVAAYLKAAPAGQITAEPFDVLGTLAERLAQRASARQAGATATTNATAQLDVVAAYGVKFNTLESAGSVSLCYDGEAFGRVLAMARGKAQVTPEQHARAALALTRHDCINPAMKPHDRRAFDDWRAQVLDSIDGAAFAQLDELVRNRLRLRRAGVWAAVALAQARQASAPQAAAQRAMDELAGVNKAELGDDEQAGYNEAAIRVSAVRWAAAHGTAPAGKLRVQLRAGEPGQTCVQLVPNTHASINANANANATAQPLAERCTYAQVWPASASPSADGRALALAVQPLDGWAELWVWRLQAQGWTLDVLPPASSAPGLGYVEFAGWVPGATPKLLLAREAKVEGRFSRRFEVLGGESLSTEKSASSPQLLAAFGQWASAAWKRGSVSLR